MEPEFKLPAPNTARVLDRKAPSCEPALPRREEASDRTNHEAQLHGLNSVALHPSTFSAFCICLGVNAFSLSSSGELISYGSAVKAKSLL
jgi:hypothetical protein